MRILRWLGIAIAVVLALGIATSFAARVSDGPIAIFAGGPLVSGALAPDPGDWSFVRDIDEVEFQLLNPPRSRITWIIHHEGAIYIPCGFLNLPIWKQWPHEALEDGRSILRIDGVRYERRAVKVEDPATNLAVLTHVSEKYGLGDVGEPDPDGVWVFRLDPR